MAPLSDPLSDRLSDRLTRKLATFDALSDEEAEVLRGVVTGTREVPARQDLVAQGSRPGFSSALVSGWAARYKTVESGRQQITAVHLPGDFVDLHGFLLHTLDHGVMALSPCTVAVLSHDRLRAVTERHPHLTRLLWLSTLVDASLHRQWIVQMGVSTAREHLAHLFCELYTRLAAVDLAAGRRFHLPVTQATVGTMIGTSAVHVNRAAQDLRATGLISWVGREVVIEDWDGLTELANFDPVYLFAWREPR